jgi:phage recombination protein Bet
MTTTEIAVAAPSRGTLALTGDQIEWTPVQAAALAHIGIEDAPQADQQVFMHVSQRTGLDPFARQIYMIARREKQPDQTYKIKWTIQTGIDGFRLIAERRDEYAGTLDPEWCGTDGVWRDVWVDRLPPVAARVKVLRHDRAHPIALPVRFAEFAATFQNGDLQGQWKTKPAHMIGKVAEAASLRKAFPQDFSGVFIPEEMDRDDQAPAYGTTRVVEGRVTADELTGRRGTPSAEPPAAAPGEPDWEALIAEVARTGNVTPAWKAAREHRPGDAALRERIQAAARERRTPHADVVEAEIVDVDPNGPVDQGQHRHMHKLWKSGGIEDRDERLAVTSVLVGRAVTSSSELTAAEADTVITALREADRGTGALYQQCSRWLDEAVSADEGDEATGGES